MRSVGFRVPKFRPLSATDWYLLAVSCHARNLTLHFPTLLGFLSARICALRPSRRLIDMLRVSLFLACASAVFTTARSYSRLYFPTTSDDVSRISSTAETDVSDFLESIRDNQVELEAFFSLMPKGGDLHLHYSGEHRRL